MNNNLRSFYWSLGTIAVAATVSFFVAKLVITDSRKNGQEAVSEESFHQWLHENLNITPDQEKILFPIEQAYEEEREKLRSEILSAGQHLAEAIRNHEADDPEIAAARNALTDAQGKLQKSTLDHFFAMKTHLNTSQGEKLLQWTHDSILHGPDN